MPLYFFDTVINGDASRDSEGTKLSCAALARAEAIVGLFALAAETTPSSAGVNAKMKVRDEKDHIVAEVSVCMTVDPVFFG